MRVHTDVVLEAEDRGRERPAFGVLVREYRIAAGLTQEALAERARMSTNGIGSLERGDRREPHRDTIALLADALALTPQQRAEFEAAAGRPGRPPRRHAASVGQGRALHNLPSSLAQFVGRETEVVEIEALMREHRLVTLTGAGGLGKTRVALEVGVALSEDSIEGVWLVELAALRDPSLVAATIARTLDAHEVPHQTLLETLIAFLRNKSLVLILDNCEHVIEEARATATAITRACPGVRILATSREALRVGGEQVYHLQSLAARDAVALFADRAVAVDARFILSDQNEPIVEEICRRLDGIPLAIELAAARVKVLAPRQLAEKLDERFRILTGGDPSGLPRQQTMRALIDWSYDLLSANERKLLRSLSIFAGGFTLESASIVVGEDVLDLLSSLVDKSLVQADLSGNEARYRLLESTHEYAREKLIESGEYEAVCRAHATAYVELAEQLDDSWDATPDRTWLPQVEPERGNWRAALDWTLGERRDVRLGARLAGALRGLWRIQQTVEGRRWVSAALEAADDSFAPATIAKLELASAELDAVLGQRKPSHAAAERAVALYRKLDDPVALLCAERIQGLGLVYVGRIAEGEPILVEALAKCRKLGLRKRTGHVLQSLAVTSYLAGDVVEARNRFLAALAIFNESGADRLAADTGQNLAEAEFHSGDAEAALHLSEEALSKGRAQGFTRSVVLLLCNRAAYFISLGRYDEAYLEAREALALAGDAQLRTLFALTLQHCAAVAALGAGDHPGDIQRGCVRAARLLGYVDERLSALGALREFTEEQEAARVRTVLRKSLGTDEVVRLMAEGRTWTEERALNEALGQGSG